jgi:hypothetical protein
MWEAQVESSCHHAKSGLDAMAQLAENLLNVLGLLCMLAIPAQGKQQMLSAFPHQVFLVFAHVAFIANDPHQLRFIVFLLVPAVLIVTWRIATVAGARLLATAFRVAGRVTGRRLGAVRVTAHDWTQALSTRVDAVLVHDLAPSHTGLVQLQHLVGCQLPIGRLGRHVRASEDAEPNTGIV